MNRRYLNIGSWNIEHFGRLDDNSDNPYPIAEHIELAGIDILALQELYVTSDSKFENSYLEKALELVEEHTGDKWEYEIFPNRNPDDKSQLCGVAWNSSRVTKDKSIKIPVKTSVEFNGDKMLLWDRIPHAIKFLTEKGKSDIIVIPIHMKSNVGKRHIVMRKRYEEAKTLMDNISYIEKKLKDKDIIILGDTNCKSRTEDAIQCFVNTGFEDLNEDDITTYVKGNSAPFDRIFVPMGEQRKAFLYSRQYILRSASPLEHDTYLSDHYLIKTMIKIRRDDD